MGRKDEIGSKCWKRNGRHEETRTPDLYRVKVSRSFTYNDLQVAGDRLNTWKRAEAEFSAGDFAGVKRRRLHQPFQGYSRPWLTTESPLDYLSVDADFKTDFGMSMERAEARPLILDGHPLQIVGSASG
jgi:hypothetical protein